MITPLGMRFERSLLVHPRPTAEASHSVDTERTHQNDAHRLAIRDGIQQISGSYYGIEEEIGGSSLLSGGEMENKLHIIHCSSGVISITEVSDAILKTNLRLSPEQRV